ncbi:MAG: PHB depolymerase family esterase [Polyangia bacterium]
MARAFLAQTFTDSRGHTLPYRLLVPPTLAPPSSAQGPAPREPVPLVLLLHGAGERGDDNQAQLRNGAAELLGSDAAVARFPCVFVLPQCPAGHRWVEVDWAQPSHVMPQQPSVPLGAVLELVPALAARYPIDGRRVYLIGLSMGGFGVYDLLCRAPERFAAAVAICGGADESRILAAAALPLWAFHGARDEVVRVERSRRIVAALQKGGGAPRYTEYPEVGHDSWSRAFAEPELLPWLFSQRR